MNNTLLTAALVATGLLGGGGAAWAQVAGSTTTSATLIESTQVAMGWSAKKAILGKVVYTESGQPIGKVEDLIISPEKNLSYFIVGAGGFVGIGRHDVAIPVSQIKGVSGRLVMPGVTKDVLKETPAGAANGRAARRAEVAANQGRRNEPGRGQTLEVIRGKRECSAGAFAQERGIGHRLSQEHTP